MNVLEYGNVFRFNAEEDISSTTPTLLFEPQFGSRFERSTGDGVTIPAVDISVAGETFLANQYVEYTFKANELVHEGRWRAKLIAEFSATKKLRTDFQRFTVLA